MDSVETILKNLKGRVVGFDSHPDSFTATLLQGRTPAEAITQKTFNKVPMGQLIGWAQKHTTSEDCFVLEASGNSFDVVRRLEAIGRTALVLESRQLGKLKEAHANNDKISAIRIGKAFLSGTAKRVWVPDLKTQGRRDCFHMHRKTVKRSTQTVNRLDSYLSDSGVRLNQSLTDLDPESALKLIHESRDWAPRQRMVIEGLAMELEAARKQRQHWESLIATEVATDAELLSLTRLTGVRDIVAFAFGAIVGDIKRFEHPKKLVKYFGLNPAFDDSGNDQWSGGIGGHGRKDVRSLLLESAQSILRGEGPLAKWGKKLLASKGSVNLAAAAVARKLVIALWYLMNGKWEGMEEISKPQAIKIGKIISKIGEKGLKTLGKDRKTLRQEMNESLLKGRVYELKPFPSAEPKAEPEPPPEPPRKFTTQAEEYGLA